MFFTNLLLYVVSFVLIWFGAGLIVTSVSKFSHKLKLSPFAFSFVFLGLLTSTPEFSVGLQAVANGDPAIFIGNLLGGIIVIFLVIIPSLAILGNGISLKHTLDNKTFITTLVVILAPALLILDERVTRMEGVLLVFLYLVLLFLIERKRGIFDRHNDQILNFKAYSYADLLKIFLGMGVVFIASNIIVSETVYFANLLNISVFYISLLVVALGTDLPEISLLIRSLMSGKRELAMGDFFGAAAASTLLFGIFTILSGGEVLVINNFWVTFVFIILAIVLLYVFSRSKNFITRKEGLVMLGVYILFIFVEMWQR